MRNYSIFVPLVTFTAQKEITPELHSGPISATVPVLGRATTNVATQSPFFNTAPPIPAFLCGRTWPRLRCSFPAVRPGPPKLTDCATQPPFLLAQRVLSQKILAVAVSDSRHRSGFPVSGHSVAQIAAKSKLTLRCGKSALERHGTERTCAGAAIACTENLRA